MLHRLGEKKDNRLRDIVSTIQSEQDRIIRAPRNVALIIQGAAGSGKTTVALHRLAYLLYQYQGNIRAERMIIFAPNSMFLNYISGVLPELGVGNVQQTTFIEWALERLGEEIKLSVDKTEGAQWFSLESDRPEINDLTPGRFKGSLSYKNWIDVKLKQYEENYLGDHDFEPWDGCVLSFQTIRQWFDVEYRHYPLVTRRERLVARLNRWLEMQLSDLDTEVRNEKSKSSKQRLRSYLKKLPEMDAVAFYKSLFDQNPVKTKNAENNHNNIPKSIIDYTMSYLKRGHYQPEDLVPLVWIHFTFHGPLGQTFDHVVLDEAQDVSPFQIALLNAFMREPSFTILGDLAQGIHAYRGIIRWEELTAVFTENQYSYHGLKLSYRSTTEIIEFANKILPFTDTALPPSQPVFRSGEPVSVVPLDNEKDLLPWMLSFIEENQDRGMQTIAIIGRTFEDCTRIDELLKKNGVEASLIKEGQREYQGGISIVPVFLTKGLEFDAVLLMDADSQRYTDSTQDAKLLYVGCTRALHRLALIYQGLASPLITSLE